MSTQVETTPTVDKEIERLARKYPAVVDEVQGLMAQLERHRPGDRIQGIGSDVYAYKARLANPSARRGKRGGFRVVYYVKTQYLVILIAIYSKTERAAIPNADIRKIIAGMDEPRA